MATQTLERASLDAFSPPISAQPFSLRLGERAVFGFLVTDPGSIAIEAEWKGAPLVLTVLDVEGRPASPYVKRRGPKAAVTVNASSAQATEGVLWRVSLVAARDEQHPQRPSRDGEIVAQGTLTIRTGPVDERRAQAAKLDLSARRKAAGEEFLRKGELQARATLRDKQLALLAAGDARRSTLQKKFQAFVRAEIAVEAKHATPASAVAAAAAAQRSSVGPAFSATSNVLKNKLNLDPTIVYISPAKGSPGDIITIGAVNLSPEEAWNEVHVTESAQLDVKAPILSIAQTDPGCVLTAMVPSSSAGQAFNGQVYVLALDHQPVFRTNSVPFLFEPLPIPAIASIAPDPVRPDDLISIQGTNLGLGAELHFIMDQGQDVLVATNYQSDELITARVPDYQYATAVTAQVYVQRKHPQGFMKSNLVMLHLKPTVPTILSFDPVAAEPRDPLLITGSGFSNPEVHMIIKPGQDLVVPIDYSSDTTILTRVPDVDGIPAACDAHVYVKCGTLQSALQTFRFIPETVVQTLDASEFQKKYGGDYYFANHEDDDTQGWIYGLHVSGLFTGHKDDDQYFPTARLKNGWVVDAISHTIGGWGGHGGRIEDSRVGTDSPYIKVHWWVDAPYNEIVYNVWIHIRGPKGVPYM